MDVLLIVISIYNLVDLDISRNLPVSHLWLMFIEVDNETMAGLNSRFAVVTEDDIF